MNVPLNPPPSMLSDLENLLLTRWARCRLGLKEEKLSPLALKPFTGFFSELLPGKPSPESAEPRRIPDSMKTDFMGWLTLETGLTDYEISEKLGLVFEDLFAEIEASRPRGGQGPGPRFVQLFLLKAG